MIETLLEFQEIPAHSQKPQHDNQNQFTCHQFFLIGPQDLVSYSSIKSQLTRLTQSNFPQDQVIQFIKTNYQKYGYGNTRLLHRIKTEYFWGGTIGYMIKSVLRDNWKLSSCITILNSLRSGMISLARYQVFLILCNMFLGLIPPQLFLRDTTFGQLMSVFEDQDEISSKRKLQTRLNKLKAIVLYFCVYFKKNSDKEKIKQNNEKSDPNAIDISQEKITFQRVKSLLSTNDILDDAVKMVDVDFRVGTYYLNDHEINSVSIFSSATSLPGELTFTDRLQLEEKFFLTHPEVLVLKLLICDPLQEQEALVIYGAQKYCKIEAINKDKLFDFSERYKDPSQLNEMQQFKKTSFIWIKRNNYPSHEAYDIIPDTQRLTAGLINCKNLFNSNKQCLVSGIYKCSASRSLKAPSDIKFITEWIAASIAKWQNFSYFVDSQERATDMRIMCKQMKIHTIRDLLEIISSFYEFRLSSKASIGLLQYIKRFVL